MRPGPLGGPNIQANTGGYRPQGPPQSPQGLNPAQFPPVPDAIKGILQNQNQMPNQPGRAGGLTIGGGIAGVASKSEDSGIKLYNERSKYKEWEFLYDPRKDNTNALGQRGGPMNPGPGPAKPGDTSGSGSQQGKK
jgi:hypothetical protein